MKHCSALFRLLITISVMLCLTIGPSWSDEHQVANRQVRVTTGIGSVQGWEQGLVQKNPNLSRWHWDPIYYYKQGYGPVTQKSSPMNGRTTGKQSVNAPGNLDNSPDVWHETKPVHIPYSPQAMAELRGRLSIPKKEPDDPLPDKETVLGKLMKRPPDGETIATYGKILPQRQSSLNTGLKYSSQSTAVYGQLLNRKDLHKNQSSRKVQTSRGGHGAKKNQ